MKIFKGNIATNPNFPREFSGLGLKYAISIGRRQPMHMAHVDCLKEIVDAGLTPVMIYGSHNSPKSKFYNPIKNPFNQDQQQKILSELMKSTFPGVNFHSLFINDYEDNNHWIERINYELLQLGISKEAAIIHYRTKEADLGNSAEQIKPLSFYNTYFTKNKFTVWQSNNTDSAMDEINSTNFRKRSIDKLSMEQHKLVNFNYILDAAESARADNPMKVYLSDIPITMLDISIKKIADELKLAYQEIIPPSKIDNLEALSEYIAKKFIHY